jgi:hypothetical protein
MRPACTSPPISALAMLPPPMKAMLDVFITLSVASRGRRRTPYTASPAPPPGPGPLATDTIDPICK